MAQLQNQGDRNKKQLHVLSSDWLKERKYLLANRIFMFSRDALFKLL